jgi:hypothetical protein
MLRTELAIDTGRTTSHAASASTRVRPLNVARKASIDSGGRPVRFASVSFRGRPCSSRQEWRRYVG